jgi:hypothetical protein
MSDYNPYEGPQAIEPLQSMQPAWSRGLFRLGHTRAVFTMALFGLMVALNFGNIYSNWLQYHLLNRRPLADSRMLRLPTSDLRLPTSDFPPPTSHLPPLTSHLPPPTRASKPA